MLVTCLNREAYLTPAMKSASRLDRPAILHRGYDFYSKYVHLFGVLLLIGHGNRSNAVANQFTLHPRVVLIVLKMSDSDNEIFMAIYGGEDDISETEDDDEPEEWREAVHRFGSTPDFTGRAGLNIELSDDDILTPKALFQLFITKDFMKNLCTATNAYAAEKFGEIPCEYFVPFLLFKNPFMWFLHISI